MAGTMNELTFKLHRMLARLHRAGPIATAGDEDAGFADVYRMYTRSTVRADTMLRRHGKASPQFAAADVESMRLFHRVKKMQGLKKGRPS